MHGDVKPGNVARLRVSLSSNLVPWYSGTLLIVLFGGWPTKTMSEKSLFVLPGSLADWKMDFDV